MRHSAPAERLNKIFTPMKESYVIFRQFSDFHKTLIKIVFFCTFFSSKLGRLTSLKQTPHYKWDISWSFERGKSDSIDTILHPQNISKSELTRIIIPIAPVHSFQNNIQIQYKLNHFWDKMYNFFRTFLINIVHLYVRKLSLMCLSLFTYGWFNHSFKWTFQK